MTRLDLVSEFSAVLPEARGPQLSDVRREPLPVPPRTLTSIVVLGQTPPPYHGQAMMINRLVRARFERIRVHHVRMAFSSSMQEVGTFGFVKVARLVSTICRALFARFRWG